MNGTGFMAVGLLLGVVALGMPVGCALPGPATTTAEETARRSYYEAMEELVAGNYVHATQLFQKVSRSPSYIRHAALARLRMGDALFLQQHFEEAIEAYRGFVSQYGSNPNLPYARYRIAICYFRRIPGQWIIVPPRHEKDQSMTRQAVRELEGFVRTFPTSSFAEDAKAKLAEARRILLTHELYVADYYAKQERWLAVAWRLDAAIRDYPELTGEPDLFWRRAEAYQGAGEAEEAARAFRSYLEVFPDGDMASNARAALASSGKPVDESR